MHLRGINEGSAERGEALGQEIKIKQIVLLDPIALFVFMVKLDHFFNLPLATPTLKITITSLISSP